ncbi:hypothetical protein [Tersicoccus mangrovi]|uniref:hypothetical protein n=1 Tax=Tersicoccus mangrovi TaxID=3121635 RepID=UPI003A7F2227
MKRTDRPIRHLRPVRCGRWSGTIVFGWVFASHQIGAAAAAFGAGVVRDVFGTYTYAWWGGATLCGIAAVLSILVAGHRGGTRSSGGGIGDDAGTATDAAAGAH